MMSGEGCSYMGPAMVGTVILFNRWTEHEIRKTFFFQGGQAPLDPHNTTPSINTSVIFTLKHQLFSSTLDSIAFSQIT